MSSKITPGLRTALLIIPIVNLFVLYDLFKAIISYAEIKKVEDLGAPMPGNFLAGYIITNIFYIEFIPFMIIQNIFNKAWKKTDKRPIKKWPYTSEWIFFILVPLLILLFIIGAFIDPMNFLPEESQAEIYCEEQCLEKHNLQNSYVDVISSNQNEYMCYCLDSNDDVIMQYELTLEYT